MHSNSSFHVFKLSAVLTDYSHDLPGLFHLSIISITCGHEIVHVEGKQKGMGLCFLETLLSIADYFNVAQKILTTDTFKPLIFYCAKTIEPSFNHVL